MSETLPVASTLPAWPPKPETAGRVASALGLIERILARAEEEAKAEGKGEA